MENQTEIINEQGISIEVPKTNNLHDWATKVNDKGVDLYNLEQRTGNVPTVEDLQRNLENNRYTGANPKGPYQLAIRGERIALKRGLTDYLNEINQGGRGDINEDDIRLITSFTPNARFAYINKLIKHVIATQKVKQGDVDFVKTIYMTEETKNALVKLITTYGVDQTKGFSVAPTNSRSGIRFTDMEGPGMAVVLRNPGVVRTNYREYDKVMDKNTIPVEKELITNIGNAVEHAMICKDSLPDVITEELRRGYFKETSQEIGKFVDRNILSYLNYLEEELKNDRVNLPRVYELAKAITTVDGERENMYVMSLLNPSAKISHKCASGYFPTASVQVSRSFIATTNALGNCAFGGFLDIISTAAVTGFNFNNDATLTGIAANPNFMGIEIGQDFPTGLYLTYRIVSGYLKTTSIAPALTAGGFYTVSQVSDGGIGLAAVGALNVTAITNYGEFSRIENGNMKFTKPLANSEPGTILYLPPDESYTDFKNLGVPKQGNNFMGYVQGGPPNAAVLRIDMIYNVELTVFAGAVDHVMASYYRGLTADFNMSMATLRRHSANITAPREKKVGVENWASPGVTNKDFNEFIKKEPISIASPKEKRDWLQSITRIWTKVVEPIFETLVPHLSKLTKIHRGVEDMMGFKEGDRQIMPVMSAIKWFDKQRESGKINKQDMDYSMKPEANGMEFGN